MTEYTIALSSVTTATRTKELLEERGIRARITRQLPAASDNGCTWGVSFFTAMEQGELEAILRRGRIRYKELFSAQMKRHGGGRDM